MSQPVGPDEKIPALKKALSLAARALTLFLISVMVVYFISHFPFGRVEYIYQGY